MGVLPGDGWTGCIFRSPSIHSPELGDLDPGARRSLPKFAARCSAGGQHSLPGPGGVYLGLADPARASQSYITRKQATRPIWSMPAQFWAGPTWFISM